MTLGELAVKKAMKMGMDEAEAYITKNRVINAMFSAEIESYKTVESLGLGIRVIKDKKIGFHATSILNESEVEKAVEKAISISKVAPADENWNTLNQKIGSSKVEGIYDVSLENLEYDTVVDAIIGGINRASENDRKVQVTRGVTTITLANTEITNNYHETIDRKGSFVSAYIMAKAIEGGNSTGLDFQSKRLWKDIDYNIIADKAAEQALKYVRSKAIESTKLPVIFKNTFFAQIFGLMLGSNINAENNQKGRSTFATKKGTQIFDERVTCIDDGLLPKGQRTRAFDCEGHPTQKTTIIEKGVLKNFIYDNYRAQKEKVESSGNARRNYFSIPNPSINNFMFEPGDSTLDDLIKDTKKGFFIERTIGEWLSRPASGELNATVTHGYLIENGELSQPVNNVILAGNFFEILKDKIVGIGKDLDNSGSIYTPSIKFSEMTIAGK
ncbi:MAG: TldD/PmbA family protein [Asgard group archaeon]|nr:TldD/PmbA family protein [Asgard group archaeon]